MCVCVCVCVIVVVSSWICEVEKIRVRESVRLRGGEVERARVSVRVQWLFWLGLGYGEDGLRVQGVRVLVRYRRRISVTGSESYRQG